MSDLGELLKKARTEKGVSLEELQETTKIRKRYLEAIEEGNFTILPGSFYVRAFIKSYSEAVGLDPDEVLRLYRNVIPDAKVEQNIEPVRQKRKTSINTDRLSKWASTLLMWCFPLLIVLIIYIYFTQIYEGKPTIPNDPKLTEQTEQNQVTPADQTNQPEPEEPVEEETPSAEPEVTYVNTDGTTYIFNASNTEKLKVELKAIGSCWVWVKKDSSSGEVILEKTYAADQTEVWEVDHSMWFRFGYPENVEIRVNDILIDREKLKENNPWNLQINLVKSGEVTDSDVNT